MAFWDIWDVVFLEKKKNICQQAFALTLVSKTNHRRAQYTLIADEQEEDCI